MLYRYGLAYKLTAFGLNIPLLSLDREGTKHPEPFASEVGWEEAGTEQGLARKKSGLVAGECPGKIGSLEHMTDSELILGK